MDRQTQYDTRSTYYTQLRSSNVTAHRVGALTNQRKLRVLKVFCVFFVAKCILKIGFDVMFVTNGVSKNAPLLKALEDKFVIIASLSLSNNQFARKVKFCLDYYVDHLCFLKLRCCYSLYPGVLAKWIISHFQL